MGVLTLNPSAFYAYGRGSWTTVGTSGPSALSDGSDATYIKLSTNYSGTNGASWKTRVASGQLPGGAKVEYMRAVVRAKTDLATGAGSEAYFKVMIQNIRGGNPLGVNRPFVSGNKKVTTSYTNIYNEAEKTTMSNGKYYGDGSITQADLGFLVIEFYEVATTHIFISKAWIEVSYDEKPVISLNSLGTIGETTSPVVTFDYTDDKMPLDAVDVELYDDSGNLLHSEEKYTLTSPSYPVPISLEDGDYTIKMRAYQQWNYVGEAPVSDWDETDFTIAIGRPAQPEFTAIEEPEQARVRLVAKSNLNLLPNDAAEGMPAAWNDLVNAKVETGETFQDSAGDRSLLMEVISGGTGYMKAFSVPLIPVKPNVYYTFGFNARAYPGDTLSNVQAGVRWLDADGDQIGADSFGANFMEIAAQWVPVYHNTQAPVGAVYATPFITVNSSQVNGWHYIDALQFQAQAAYAEPLPAWSRGGFASNDSMNLLTYGDSTFEGASHWTAVAPEAGSKEAVVSVVNVFSETNDEMYSYQGDNMLKLATVDTLIKRDVKPAFSNTTSITVPRGLTVEGDYVVVQITVQGTATVATPAGWTLLNTTAATTVHRIYTFGKFALNADPASYTFTASASGKHAVSLMSWSGIDTTTPLDSIAVSTVQSGTTFTVPTSNVPHNAPVMQSAWGRRAAATVATSFSSNLGGNYDVVLSTTANTANEVAATVFSRKYSTESTSALSLTGRTITCANSLTDVLTVSIVLRPDRSTVRATLRDYEYYEFDSTLTYTVHAALMGAAGDFGPTSANRAVGFLVDVYDNDKNFINGYYAYQGFAVPGEWLKMSNTINVPDNPLIKYATIRIEIDQITDYEAYYIDAVSLYQSSTNLGYIEGFKEIDGPYIELEYSEDEGETWQTADSTDSTWMVQKITDFSDATIEFLDYEIASNTPRLYRMYNWKMEEGNLLQSEYSVVHEAEISLYRVWMHLITDPVGTIYHFEYDGTGRDDAFNKQASIQQFNGREYGQAYFSESSSREINANVQLPTGEDVLALKRLDKTKALVIFRDGRGRRVKGLLTVKFSDERWGNTASFSAQVLGLQP